MEVVIVNNFNPAEKSFESATVNFPIERVYQATLNAISSTKSFKLISQNNMFYRILIKTKSSLFSWGEKMTVQLNDLGDKTEISISSELKTSIGSQAPLTQATIGKKNKKNIDKLFQLISNYV